MFRQRPWNAAILATFSVLLCTTLGACGDDAANKDEVFGPAAAQSDAGGSMVTNPPTSGSGAPSSPGMSNDAGAGVPPSPDAAAPSTPSGGSSTDDGSAPSTTTEEAGAPSDGGEADDAGATAAGDAGLPPWATREDLGKGDGKDVITIGDSWMAGPLNGAGIQAGLDRQMTKYRHYAFTATTLLSGQIPGQYDQAKRANPDIKTVIMTGGGNDVMFTGSCTTDQGCQELGDKIADALDKLWSRMAEDGVKDVIYVAYSDAAGATPADRRGMGKPVPVCSSGKINCHVLETTSLVQRSDLLDGIHPNSAANDRIAKALLQLMEMRKIRR